MKKSIKKIKKHLAKIIKLDDSPHSIALGFAIGTLIAIAPTLGLDIFIALLVLFIFPNLNKISLFGGLLLWNPIFAAPLLPLSYKIGTFLLGNASSSHFNLTILNTIYNFSLRLIVGSYISAVIFAILSYFVVRLIVYFYQKK